MDRLRERQVAGHYVTAVFVSLGNDIEEQVSPLTTKRQIPDLVDDQQPRG